MNFTCSRKDLVEAFNVVSKAVSSKPQMPILSGIYMKAEGSTLELQANNFEMGIITKIPVNTETPGEIVVTGKYLQEIVRKLSGETVNIEHDEAHHVANIKSDTANFKLLSMSSEDFPKVKSPETFSTFSIRTSTLKNLIRKTAYACASEEVRPIFTGCCLELAGNTVSMIATNTHRLAIMKDTLEAELENLTFVVPSKTLWELFKMLDASDYGVLQVRHRIILVGWRKENDLGYPVIEQKRASAVINDILNDLPKLKSGEVKKVAKYRAPSNSYLEESGIRSKEDEFVTENISRPVNENDAKIYACAIKLWNKKHIRIKYTDLPKEYKTQKNENSFLDRFKVVDGQGYAHTVVAHLAKDGHYYIHPSLEDCRSISVREAARMQSFPDNFYFEGSRSAMFKQIGNAVPPLMAKSIAESIKSILRK